MQLCQFDQWGKLIIVIIIHSFIQAISIAPLQDHYYSVMFPTQHGYCVRVTHQSATGNCEWRSYPRSLCVGYSGIRTRDPSNERRESTNQPPCPTLLLLWLLHWVLILGLLKISSCDIEPIQMSTVTLTFTHMNLLCNLQMTSWSRAMGSYCYTPWRTHPTRNTFSRWTAESCRSTSIPIIRIWSPSGSTTATSASTTSSKTRMACPARVQGRAESTRNQFGRQVLSIWVIRSCTPVFSLESIERTYTYILA